MDTQAALQRLGAQETSGGREDPPPACGGPGAPLSLAALLQRNGMPSLRVCSWNVASFFGGAWADVESMRKHRRKVRELMRLSTKADVICLQEVRG